MELFDRMTFVLKGGKCKGSWALRIVMSDTESSDDDEDIYHNLLVLSVGKQTKLISFQDGGMQPLQEDMTTFVLDETTIASGTLLGGIVAVQVYGSAFELDAGSMKPEKLLRLRKSSLVAL